MKTLITFITLSLLLSACATTTPNADKRTWSTLACSGFLEWTDCWKKAEKLCPNGFDIANQVELRGHQKREVDVACK